MPPSEAPVLVTGAAGFIGFHCCRALLSQGRTVIGLDNLNDYYDPALKSARLRELEPHSAFSFRKLDLVNSDEVASLFRSEKPLEVLHLAAQAGVRYSLENPAAYVQSNVTGFLSILEACRAFPPKHLVCASSSSVYGMNSRQPLSESHNVDHPVSLYAATKKADELMAHTYSHLFDIPITCLRFFTVYGPWGRPDMAYFSFTKAILEGTPIKVFNEGRLKRDFTYVDDIVEGVLRVLERPASPDPRWNAENPDPASSSAPYRVFNIGNHEPVELLLFISVLERLLGKEAQKELVPMQPGDVFETYADVDRLAQAAGFKPSTPLEEGLRKFVEWYRRYYGA
jgi:UDP-glucuronate 4-epimerase